MDKPGESCILRAALGARSQIGRRRVSQIESTNQGKDDDPTSWTTIRIHIKAAIHHIRVALKAEEPVATVAAAEEDAAAIAEVAKATVISGKVPRRS